MIEIKNLYYSYQESEFALKNINLKIESGQFVSILGSNGSGKSTLALCLSGLLNPTSGEILIDGEAASSDNVRKKTGILFQNPDNQILTSTVERELAFTLENLNTPYEIMKNKVSDYINKFKLKNFINRIPDSLSGGEKQKITLASVLISEPDYLILDEPTSLLSPKSKSEMIEIIKDYHKKNGKTVILITQISSEALFSDKVVIMKNGEIVNIEKPENIFNESGYLQEYGIRPVLLKDGGK